MFNDDPVDFNINKSLQFIFVSTQQWCQKWGLNKLGIIDKLILLIQNFSSSVNNKYFNNVILIIITTLYKYLFNHDQFLHLNLILNRIGNAYNNILIYKCHQTINHLYSLSPRKYPLSLEKNYTHKKII